MKKLLVILSLVISVISFGQILKLRTTAVAYRIKKNSQFTQWSKWEKTSVLVSVNIRDGRIIIDSSMEQIYDILDGNYDESNGIGRYYCMDSNGKRCIIEIVNETRNLYIRYNDWEHVYDFYVIK